MADVKAWITVNGRHVPIMEGENTAQALSRHFNNIRKNKFKDRDYDMYSTYYKAKQQGYTEDQAEEIARDYAKEKYGKNWDKMSNTTIRGQQNKKFKQNQAENAFQKTIEKTKKEAEKYRKTADENDKDYQKEIDNAIDKGDRLHARTLQAQRDARYNRAKNEAYQLELEGEARARENYEWRMKRPNRYRMSEYKYDKEADFGYTDKIANAGSEYLQMRGYGSSYNRKYAIQDAWRAIKKKYPNAKVYDSDTYLSINGNKYTPSYSKSKGWSLKQIKNDNMPYSRTGTNSAVKQAYREYIKQHPNSLMKFSTFKKTYDNK